MRKTALWAAIPAILVSVLATFIVLPVLHGYMARDFKLTDYPWHFGAARRMCEEGRLVPHPLFHVLTIVVKAAVPTLEWWTAGLSVVLFFHLWLGAILVRLCSLETGEWELRTRAIAVTGSLRKEIERVDLYVQEKAQHGPWSPAAFARAQCALA